MADAQPSPPLSAEDRADAEARAMIERAERAWQRQVEREEAAFGHPGGMTPVRWTLVVIAAASLALLIAQQL